jgi:hypothetical protein
MRRSFAIIFFLSTATPVSAWELHSIKDPVNNELVTRASVSTTGASLIVACTNGEPQPRLSLDQSVGLKEVAVSYRFDDGPVTRRMAMISPDGHELWPWPTDYSAAAWKLRRVKRFRLNVGETLFEFDLSTGDTLPLILC